MAEQAACPGLILDARCQDSRAPALALLLCVLASVADAGIGAIRHDFRRSAAPAGQCAEPSAVGRAVSADVSAIPAGAAARAAAAADFARRAAAALAAAARRAAGAGRDAAAAAAAAAAGSGRCSRRRKPRPDLPPGQRQPRGTPQPANTAPQPGDEVIAEPPSQKIPNATAMFSGLDKITGRIISFDVAINETVQFGALQVVPRVCNTRPPTETQNTNAFIEVSEVTLAGRSAPHFHRLDVRLEPGPARGRASDLRYLDHRL